jgi:CDGSH iron-sulfur domain-containing protein 3
MHNIRGLQKGDTYQWCACGQTKTRPWCDGACESIAPDEKEGRRWKPVTFTVPVQQTVWSVCGCKYTNTPPLCDATHCHIDETKPPCTCKPHAELEW